MPQEVESVSLAFVREPGDAVEHVCPNCHSPALYRSKARTLSERMRRNYSAKRLFRCHDCNWRGWLIPLDFGDPEATEPAVTPDLAALDSAVQTVQLPLRRTFSPRDLQ
jgi:hypothetical protein